MSIGAIGSGSTTYITKTQSSGNEAVQLQRQIAMYQQQLDALNSTSSNDKSSENAIEKQKETLEKRIAEMEKKLQQLSSNGQENVVHSETTASNNQKIESAQINNPRTVGNIMDLYV